MKIIKPEVHIERQDWGAMLKRIETKGRVCYKSEDRITHESAEKFIASIINRGHLSVLEHETISVKFVVDRGVSHEIVRHRIGSYSQESTRYCNYTQGKFGNEITVIEPFFYLSSDSEPYKCWQNACEAVELYYIGLTSMGSTPQEARSILPNSLKTEIWVTYNLREWLHFFSLRAAKTAHPQMRQVAIPLLFAFKNILPEIFVVSDISFDREFPKEHYAEVKLV